MSKPTLTCSMDTWTGKPGEGERQTRSCYAVQPDGSTSYTLLCEEDRDEKMIQAFKEYLSSAWSIPGLISKHNIDNVRRLKEEAKQLLERTTASGLPEWSALTGFLASDTAAAVDVEEAKKAWAKAEEHAMRYCQLKEATKVEDCYCDSII